MTKRTVKWAHPSIKIFGQGYGDPVELDVEDADAYQAAGWCVDPDTLLRTESKPEPAEVDDPDQAALDDGTLTELPDLSELTVDELKDRLRSRGLKLSGNKAALVRRLQNAPEEAPDAAGESGG